VKPSAPRPEGWGLALPNGLMKKDIELLLKII
jgi:hypothetical protein